MTVPDEHPLSEVLACARAAVLYGVTHRGFDGPDGVDKDEALEYAAALIHAIDTSAVEWGIVCRDGTWYRAAVDEDDARTIAALGYGHRAVRRFIGPWESS